MIGKTEHTHIPIMCEQHPSAYITSVYIYFIFTYTAYVLHSFRISKFLLLINTYAYKFTHSYAVRSLNTQC